MLDTLGQSSRGAWGGDVSPEGIPAGGMQLGTESSQSGSGRQETASLSISLGSPAAKSSAHLGELYYASCCVRPGWLKCEVPGRSSFSRLGLYVENSATGGCLPCPTALLHQPAWMSPLHIHFTYSWLQEDGVREVQSRRSVFLVQEKDRDPSG